ncbi:MAG: hypothetical protein C5B58_11740 [Acidobacteria bacterium]|nr:MAG: hypothetical protein C5B58_11740 [Acidobacteriota bacterium]
MQKRVSEKSEARSHQTNRKEIWATLLNGRVNAAATPESTFKTRSDVTTPAGGSNGKRPLAKPNSNWVVIYRNGRLTPTVNGQTRRRVRQISRRELDALSRKRPAAIVAEEYRRGTPLIRNSELTISRTATEHFNGLKKGGAPHPLGGVSTAL